MELFGKIDSSPRQRARRYASGILAVVTALVVVVLWSSGSSPKSQLAERTLPSAYPTDVWVYSGSTAVNSRLGSDLGGVSAIKNLIRRDHYHTDLHHIKRLSSGALRDAFWNPHCEVVVFPPLNAYPTLSRRAAVDMRAWVGKGGNLVFIGSYLLELWLNDIFNWHIEGAWGPGPYFLNPRAALNTPFGFLSSEIKEVSQNPVAGVASRSLPQPDAHCIYDNNGICVAFYIKYHLGSITYVADAFADIRIYDDPQAAKWVDLLHAAVMM